MISTKRQISFIEKSFHFTQRQMDVIKCISEGLENEEICKKLGIEYNTLSAHLWNIRSKLGVKGKFGIVVKLIKLVQDHKI